MNEEFDVIIIGAGPAGEHTVGRTAKAGLRSAIVESELAGGECSYWACIPSKTLLRPGRVVTAARSVPGARQAVSGAIDSAAALARRNEMVSNWDDAGQAQWVSDAGAVLVRGHGRLAGEKKVTVEAQDGSTRELTATMAVIIATGSQSATPPIPGLSETRHWDNRQATSASAVPARLVVLGAGPVGLELAQAWKRLGSSEVTVIELADRVLASSEPFVGEILAEALAKDGIKVHLGRRATHVGRRYPDGPVSVSLDDDSVVKGDELLVAVGRRPRTDDIGLDSVGLKPGEPIPVDGQQRVIGVPGQWLYAIGDANGETLLTHMGKYQGRIAARSILGEDTAAEAEHRAVTAVVFTDPQVGTVGLTEQAARNAGIEVRTLRVEVSSVAGTSVDGEDNVGTTQLVVDTATDMIVGATFVGPDIGELLHAATIAVVGRVRLGDLRHAVPAFPTVSEVWLELVESYFEPAPATSR